MRNKLIKQAISTESTDFKPITVFCSVKQIEKKITTNLQVPPISVLS